MPKRPTADHPEVTGQHYVVLFDWLIESDVSDRAVRLYCVLHRFTTSANRSCYPTLPTLATTLRTSEQSVRRAMKELIDAGAVTVERRAKPDGSPTSNLYHLADAYPLGQGQLGGGVVPPVAGGGTTGGTRVVPPVVAKAVTSEAITKEPTGADAPEGPAKVADRLAKVEWERRRDAGEVQPMGGFVAFRTRITEAVKAGHDEAELARVLPGMTTFTRGSFEFALRGKGRAGPQLDTDRGAPSGAVAL